MKEQQDGAARRVQIEVALADYPDLDKDRLADVIRWFRKEASALDVATLASNEAIAEPYRRFRAEHIDPLNGSDMMKGMLFAAIVGGGVFLLAWPML